MLGNFTYCNPAKLYFGDQSLDYLKTELPKYGKNVVLIYGGGSIKKNGIYDDVIKILEAQGKNVAEIAGVMPNPTLAKLYEASRSRASIRRICSWPSAAVRSAITPRRCPSRSTARKTRGRNTSCALRSRPARRCRSAAC